MNLVLEPMIAKAKRQLDEIFERGTPEAKENVLLFLRLHQALYQLNDNPDNGIELDRQCESVCGQLHKLVDRPSKASRTLIDIVTGVEITIYANADGVLRVPPGRWRLKGSGPFLPDGVIAIGTHRLEDASTWPLPGPSQCSRSLVR